MTEKQLLAAAVYVLCVGGGGGGGGVQRVFSDNYGGVAPVFTPLTNEALAIDTSTGTIWEYYSGAWH